MAEAAGRRHPALAAGAAPPWAGSAGRSQNGAGPAMVATWGFHLLVFSSRSIKISCLPPALDILLEINVQPLHDASSVSFFSFAWLVILLHVIEDG